MKNKIAQVKEFIGDAIPDWQIAEFLEVRHGDLQSVLLLQLLLNRLCIRQIAHELTFRLLAYAWNGSCTVSLHRPKHQNLCLKLVCVFLLTQASKGA